MDKELMEKISNVTTSENLPSKQKNLAGVLESIRGIFSSGEMEVQKKQQIFIEVSGDLIEMFKDLNPNKNRVMLEVGAGEIINYYKQISSDLKGSDLRKSTILKKKIIKMSDAFNKGKIKEVGKETKSQRFMRKNPENGRLSVKPSGLSTIKEVGTEERGKDGEKDKGNNPDYLGSKTPLKKKNYEVKTIKELVMEKAGKDGERDKGNNPDYLGSSTKNPSSKALKPEEQNQKY